MMEDDVWAAHVNDEKNDFADWIKPLDEEKAEELKQLKDKFQMIGILEDLMSKQ